MKKYFISLGLIAAAAFTLTNCAQEFDNPEVYCKPFQIIAGTPDTKTVNDGMSTKWAEGDAINLFHTEWEATDYSSNNKFTVADLETGVFTGTLAEELAEVNDWYALYPYSEKITTPAAVDAGYTYIGHSKGLNQTGYNSMASLKGSVCPLYGVATEVETGTTPELTMMHLSSVVEVMVTNETETPLVVKTASLTATEDIVGSYYIDITKYPVVYKPSGDNYVSTTATVNVSGGTELAKGESACLYLAIKPFTAPLGQSLKLSVNGYEKSLALRQDVTFTAGKIKRFEFAYDKVSAPVEPEPEGVVSATLTFDADKSARTSFSTEQQVWEQNGIKFTNDKAQSTNSVADYAAPVRLYKGSAFTIEAPGYITKIVFNSEKNYSDKTYFDYLKASVGDCTEDGTKATVVLNGTTSTVTYSAATGQVRLYDITVYYMSEGYTPPTLESISVSDFKEEFTQGNTFSFGGKVIAHWSNDTETDVTGAAEFTGYDMSATGTQTVTVSYQGMTCTYNITVAEKPQGGDNTGGASVEIVFKDRGYANGESVDGVSIAVDNNISLVFSQAASSTAPAYYDSGEAIRMYQKGATLDVTANGKTITSIEFTFANNQHYIKTDVGSLTEEGAIRTWTGSASAVKFTSSGTDKNTRAYIAKMVITYQD